MYIHIFFSFKYFPIFFIIQGPLELARETFPERVITEGDSFNVTYNVTDNGNPAVSLPPSWRFNELALMENGRVIITEYVICHLSMYLSKIAKKCYLSAQNHQPVFFYLLLQFSTHYIFLEHACK